MCKIKRRTFAPYSFVKFFCVLLTFLNARIVNSLLFFYLWASYLIVIGSLRGYSLISMSMWYLSGHRNIARIPVHMIAGLGWDRRTCSCLITVRMTSISSSSPFHNMNVARSRVNCGAGGTGNNMCMTGIIACSGFIMVYVSFYWLLTIISKSITHIGNPPLNFITIIWGDVQGCYTGEREKELSVP